VVNGPVGHPPEPVVELFLELLKKHPCQSVIMIDDDDDGYNNGLEDRHVSEDRGIS